MTPVAFLNLGFWEIVILVASAAVLLGVPIVVVAAWTYIRRVIREIRARGRKRMASRDEAREA